MTEEDRISEKTTGGAGDSYSRLDEKVPSDGSKRDAQIAELQDENECLKNGRNEDRFIFGVIILILLNVIFFSHTDGWGGPLAVLVLELIVVMILARKLGVEDITNILDKYVLNGYLRRK